MIGDENLSNRSELRRRYNYETVYDKDVQKLYSTRINVDVKPTDKQMHTLKLEKNQQGKIV